MTIHIELSAFWVEFWLHSIAIILAVFGGGAAADNSPEVSVLLILVSIVLTSIGANL